MRPQSFPTGRIGIRIALMVAGWACWAASHAGQVQVAVASNFAAPFQKLSASFAQATGHKAIMIAGSTGKFHTQIRSGAPFEVLLAADDETPRRLEAEGLTVKGERFTYAIGRLVLWSSRPGVVDAQGDVLRKGGVGRLAIANPASAPYGAAARQVLQAMGVDQALAPRLVQGESIAQTHQFVASGNADAGFVALSQLMPLAQGVTPGSWWLVPAKLHQPIRQDAVLLARGKDNAAARALLDHLRSDTAQALIRSHGYER